MLSIHKIFNQDSFLCFLANRDTSEADATKVDIRSNEEGRGADVEDRAAVLQEEETEVSRDVAIVRGATVQP